MANATLTMNVDELADAIAAKVSKVDPSEHEAVKADRDEARETLRLIVHRAVPSQWANYDDPVGSVRKLLDGWHERGNALHAASREVRDAIDAKVHVDRDRTALRESVSKLSDTAIELRGDLKTACDERDEFRRQLDEAQAKLSGDGVLAKDAVMVHEGTDPYGVLSAGEVVTVVHGKVDKDGDVRVAREGQRGDWEYARVSNLKPRKRTYKAGDPAPEDKTVTLTGENDKGRKVTLKYGRHSAYESSGGSLTWWDVDAKPNPTNALLSGGFNYWTERFGPLTEV